MFNNLRVAAAAYRIYRDPDRLDQVLEVATRLASSRERDLERLASVLASASPAAEAAIAQRELIRYDPAELAECPAGSLGRAVHDHCEAYGIHPSTFPVRPKRTAGEYVIAHIENTHDIWHPVCGFGSDAIDEIGLQAFYLGQFPNLLGLLLVGIAPLHLLAKKPADYPRLMNSVTRGWLLGKRAKPLFGVRWDTMWNRPLADVRRELDIDCEGVERLVAPGAEGLNARLRAGVH